jgi:glycopeptide antibiotics resistance protein
MKRQKREAQAAIGVYDRTINNQWPTTTNPDGHSQQRATAMGAASRILFLLCVLFIFYETAIPFRFDLTRSGLRYRWERSEWIPFLDNDGGLLSLADAVGNVLLFVPFGFFLHGWRLAQRFREPVDKSYMRATMLAALFFSGGIEILQLGFDRRTTSVNDLLTNLAGAYIGAKLALAYPTLITVAWNRIQRILRQRPILAVWLVIMSAQILIALAPFDFTFKMENFQRQWLRWQYSWKALADLWPVSPTWIELARKFPHYEYLFITLLATGGCGILLGSFWMFFSLQSSTSPRMIWGAAFIMIGFYPALTLLQFMVQSAYPFVLFPIMGMAGVISGALLMMSIIRLALFFRQGVKN